MAQYYSIVFTSFYTQCYLHAECWTHRSWKCGAGGSLPLGGRVCVSEVHRSLRLLKVRPPQPLRCGLDAVLEMVGRIHVSLMHLRLWQPLAAPQLYIHLSTPRWGRKEVGPFGSILSSWGSWVLTHMHSNIPWWETLLARDPKLYHLGGGGNVVLLLLHLIPVLFCSRSVLELLCWTPEFYKNPVLGRWLS